MFCFWTLNFHAFPSDGWEFELQAAPIEKNRNDCRENVKFIQTTFVTNIQAMLENFVSLYELRQSSLLDVFLRPSSQFDEFNPEDEFVQKHYVSARFYDSENDPSSNWFCFCCCFFFFSQLSNRLWTKCMKNVRYRFLVVQRSCYWMVALEPERRHSFGISWWDLLRKIFKLQIRYWCAAEMVC